MVKNTSQKSLSVKSEAIVKAKPATFCKLNEAQK